MLSTKWVNKKRRKQKNGTLVCELFLYKRKQNGQKITYVSKPEDVSFKMVQILKFDKAIQKISLFL